jgi:FtsP/CotA-like multicopper oxidase with cupredoxin domain
MGHMRWTINGRTFQMEDVAEDKIVRLGSTEVWEFANTTGGMGMMHNFLVKA